MPASELLKRYYFVPLVAGSLSAVLTTQFEPFKSHFSLAILAGFAVGVICTMIEVSARSIAKKLNRATHSSDDGPGARDE